MFDKWSHCVVVGKRGIITIPSRMRDVLGIEQGNALKVTIDEKGRIIIEKVGQ